MGMLLTEHRTAYIEFLSSSYYFKWTKQEWSRRVATLSKKYGIEFQHSESIWERDFMYRTKKTIAERLLYALDMWRNRKSRFKTEVGGQYTKDDMMLILYKRTRIEPCILKMVVNDPEFQRKIAMKDETLRGIYVQTVNDYNDNVFIKNDKNLLFLLKLPMTVECISECVQVKYRQRLREKVLKLAKEHNIKAWRRPPGTDLKVTINKIIEYNEGVKDASKD